MKNIKIFFLIAVLSLVFCTEVAQSQTLQELKENCRPAINADLPQFIIGYGSLMQEKSKLRDSSLVGRNHPIYLSGFNRGWIEAGTGMDFITYLGVRPEPGAEINAVYFKLEWPEVIKIFDKREGSYCRVLVSPQQIKTLENEILPRGEYWIYLTKESRIKAPTQEKPIVQSYVDIFLSGCLQLEEKHHLKDFAKDCIKTTNLWSVFWVNNRSQKNIDLDPYLRKIDELLAIELPNNYK